MADFWCVKLRTMPCQSQIIQNRVFKSADRCHSIEPRSVKTGLYRIWCGVHTLGDWHSAFVNPAGQLLLIRRVNNS